MGRFPGMPGASYNRGVLPDSFRCRDAMARSRSRRERTQLSRSDAARSFEPSASRSTSRSAGSSRTASSSSPQTEADAAVPSDSRKAPFLARRTTREALEAIAITIAAALLFRTFVAEPFLIPTGSMAPGLMGRHMDIVCPECGRPYQASASSENAETAPMGRGPVVVTSCPDCRFPLEIDRRDPMQRSFDGDRVIVSKFFYDLFPPTRWDVIVFKFPLEPKTNYIKRLIGLPGETVRVQGGDIFTSPEPDGPFTIARKSPDKLHAMLELVDDTAYRPARLLEAGWPEKWRPWSAEDAPGTGGFGPAAETGWTRAEGSTWDYTLTAAPSEAPSGEVDGANLDRATRWLRFQQVLPVAATWQAVLANRPVDELTGVTAPAPELVTDLTGYNNSLSDTKADRAEWAGKFSGLPTGYRADGHHWVGDLAVEADVEVLSEAGLLRLMLVEAGWVHTATIDVATGAVTLALRSGRADEEADEASGGFTSETSGASRVTATPAATRTGASVLRGPGRYRVRFANCDNELTLWVDGQAVTLDAPATFTRSAELRPVWTEADPLDLAPAAVGGVGLTARFDALRVFRDIYYIAADNQSFLADYDKAYAGDWAFLAETFRNPATWPDSPLFAPGGRRATEYAIPEGFYLPMGDNSSHSSDARFWPIYDYQTGEPIGPLPEHLLIGKATCVIWPHLAPGPLGMPYWPNVPKMRRIR